MNTQSTEEKSLPPSHSSKKSVFPFLRLPRELRDQIYAYCMASGDFTILRTSKDIKEEVTPLLSKHGILRINLGFPNRTNWPVLGTASVAAVQNVELRIKASSDAAPLYLDILSGLYGKETERESCVVILSYNKDSNAPYYVHHNRLYIQLARLTGFKKLVFKIVFEKHDFKEYEGYFTEEEFRRIFPYGEGLLEHHRGSYERVRLFLEGCFGPARFDDGVGGHCLEFCPLESLPDGWRAPDPMSWRPDFGEQD